MGFSKNRTESIRARTFVEISTLHPEDLAPVSEPFNTSHEPLDYSGNPGVHGVSYRGVHVNGNRSGQVFGMHAGLKKRFEKYAALKSKIEAVSERVPHRRCTLCGMRMRRI